MNTETTERPNKFAALGIDVAPGTPVLDALADAGGNFRVDVATPTAHRTPDGRVLTLPAEGENRYGTVVVTSAATRDAGPAIGSVVGSGVRLDSYKVHQYEDTVRSFLAPLDEMTDGNLAAVRLSNGGGRLDAWYEVNRFDPVTEGDTFAQYVRFTTSHDGSAPTQYGTWTERLICSNGMILGSWAHTLKVRHTKNSEARVSGGDAAQAVARTLSSLDIVADRMKVLAATPVTTEQIGQMVDHVFDIDLSDEGLSKNKRTAHQNRRNEVIRLYNGEGTGIDTGTAYGAYNALTEYLDHHGRSAGHNGVSTDEARTLRALDLGTDREKTRGYTFLRELVAA